MPYLLTIGIFCATVALIAFELLSESKGAHDMHDRYHE
jgi:hypothetical protein